MSSRQLNPTSLFSLRCLRDSCLPQEGLAFVVYQDDYNIRKDDRWSLNLSAAVDEESSVV